MSKTKSNFLESLDGSVLLDVKKIPEKDYIASQAVDTIAALRSGDWSNRKIIQISTERGNPSYYLDSADTTSADDDFLVIVDAGLNRWKLIETSVDAAPTIQSIYDSAAYTTTQFKFKDKIYTANQLTFDNDVALDESTHPHVISGTNGGGFTGGTRLVSDVAGTHTLRCRNAAGMTVSELTLDGAGLVDTVLDLAWIGTSGGAAPANLNVLEKIWIEGVKAGGVGIDLSQFHDSTIDSITVRGGSTTSKALVMNSPGGYQSLSNFRLYSGRSEFACQNGQWDKGVVSGGLDLINGSYNEIGFKAVHWISGIAATDGTNAYINSKATGNGTRSLTFTDNYVNSVPANPDLAFISGRFWNGAVITGGKIQVKRPVWDIENGAGDGNPAVFHFKNVYFEDSGATPAIQWPTNVIIIIENCTRADGTRWNQVIHPMAWTKPAGDFSSGCTLTLETDICYYPTSLQWFRWDGGLPKTVGAASSPGSTGGEGEGAWQVITNDTNTVNPAIDTRLIGNGIVFSGRKGDGVRLDTNGISLTTPATIAAAGLHPVFKSKQIDNAVIDTWYVLENDEKPLISAHNGIFEVYVCTPNGGPKGKWTIAKIDFNAIGGGAAITADTLVNAGDGTSIELRWQSGVTEFYPEVRLTGTTQYDLSVLVVGISGTV